MPLKIPGFSKKGKKKGGVYEAPPNHRLTNLRRECD